MQRWQEAQAYEVGFWTAFFCQREGSRRFAPDATYVLRFEEYLLQGYFKDKRVLEIGCGPAGPIYRLDSSFKVGIEPMALTFYRKFGQPNNTVHLVQGVGERLPFASSCFDVVVLWNVVDHAFAPLEVLKEARRVLTSQGVLALWVHAIRPFAVLFRPLGGMLDTGHPFHLTVGQYAKLLEKAHFEIVHMKRKPFRDKGSTLKRRIARRFVENLWAVASAT